MKIQKKLLLSILPVVLITVIAVTSVAIYISKDVLENQVKENAKLLIKSYSTQLNAKVFQTKKMSQDLSAAIETAVNVETVLLNTRKRYSEISRIFYTSLDGSVKDMAPYHKTLFLTNFYSRDEWQESLLTQKVVISDPVKYLGEDVFLIYSPVLIDYTFNNKPEIVGVSIIVLPTKYIFEFLNDVLYGETGSIFVINNRGSFIFHKEKSYILTKDITDIPATTDLSVIQSSMVNQKAGIGSYYLGSEKKLISFSGVPTVSWSVGVTVSYKEFTKKIDKVIIISIGILLFGIMVASYFIYLIVHSVTRPLSELTEISNKIACGNLSIRSNLNIKNEVGQLSSSFDSMVDQLDNYNKNLESEVLERTKELLAMNEELEATNETLDSNAREMEMLNEELQSSNETLDLNGREMEAMNEELKVSNESMEAVNEELNQTVDELDVSNRQLAKTRDSLWSEMELAQRLQTVLLPETPHIDGYDISAFMTTTSSVGGDYYDVINVEGKDWFLIGDVSGHGVTAGLIMMMVQTSLHVALTQNPSSDPVELLTIINKIIHSNISKLGGNRYMTLTVFACLENNKFSFAGAHLPIIIYRKESESIEMVETPGAWIGLIDDIKNLNNNREFQMNSGDVLLLYTDGISEAVDKSGKNFSQFALSELFKDSIDLDSKGICDVIKKSSENLIVDDDVTIMVLKKV